jgi:hypothetical protein
VDYRKFLNKQEELVLPWFGGQRVVAEGRRLRLTALPAAPGWYRFRVQGRKATLVAPAEAPDLEALPRVRGHVLGPDRLVTEGALVEPFPFPPEDEPEVFAPVSARRWHSGHLLFEHPDFEDEAEEQVRQAWETGAGLEGVKGVAATLRAAYGIRLAESAAERLEVPLVPLEIRARLGAIADGGRATAEAEVRRLDARRQAEIQRLAGRTATLPSPISGQARRLPRGEDAFEARAEQALHNAGAELIRSRRSGGGQREVVYRFMGQRFVTIVHEASLQVIDAGICLDGADQEVTLESLPGVIREAVDTGVLYVTRRVRSLD